MKKTLTVFLILFVLFTSEIFSQSLIGAGRTRFLPGDVVLENGTVLNGMIQIPKRPSSQSIKFKKTEKEEAQKIKISDIRSFSIINDSGEKFTLESNYIDQSKNAGITKVTKFRIFLLVEVEGYATLYKIGDEFRTDKKGNLYLYSYNAGDGSGAVNFRYYVKKKGAEYAEIFTYENPVNGFLPDISRHSVVKAMETHLSEYPELIEKVRSKEIEKMDLAQIFRIYNDFMDSDKK